MVCSACWCNGIGTHIFSRSTANSVSQRITAKQSGYRNGKRRICFSPVFAYIVGFYRCRCVRDGQGTISNHKAYIIVVIIGPELTSKQAHGVCSIIGTRRDSTSRTCNLTGNQVGTCRNTQVITTHTLCSAIIGHSRRITRNRHSDRSLGNREDSIYIGHIIVTLYGITGRSYGISSRIFTCCTANRILNQTSSVAILQTTYYSSQGRIRSSIYLCLGIGSHGSRCSGNGHTGRIVGYIVVALSGSTRRSNGVSSHILSCYSVNRVLNHTSDIAILQTTHHSGQYRIRGSIYLRLGLGGHRSRRSGDGHNGSNVCNIVVTLGCST